jgi:hypothetical protein
MQIVVDEKTRLVEALIEVIKAKTEVRWLDSCT